MPDAFLLNCWYQAAWSDELDAGWVSRTLLDTPVVLFRSGEGIGALLDRCPHRFAPLSAGQLIDGRMICGYHGLGFDGTGRCVHNPHGPITNAMRARSFPAVERHTAIWIWMGDPALADASQVPDLSFIDRTPELARVKLYMHTAADYRLIADNVMDLSHADYLHASSLGGMMAHTKARTFERDGALVAEWTSPACPAPPIFQDKVPSPQLANYWIEVAWRAPALMVLGTAVVPSGSERTPADEAVALHNLTPETSGSTHYFMCATRGDRLDDAEYSRGLKIGLTHAFMDEDKPMLEQQQTRIGDADLWSLNPILLNIDSGAVQARRRLEAHVKQERQSA